MTTYTPEQIERLLERTQMAADLKNGRMDERRSAALMQFHADFNDPASVAALLSQLLQQVRELEMIAEVERVTVSDFRDRVLTLVREKAEERNSPLMLRADVALELEKAIGELQ